MTTSLRSCKHCGHSPTQPGGWECRSCSQLKHKYNLTRVTRDGLLEAQDFRCAICSDDIHGFGSPRASSSKGKGVVDHCHITNKVRGILCNNCNTALGLLKDDPHTLAKAINYLENHNE